ncbi:MAG: 8-oxo-dGTP diphosphatase [Planctomycetota bacterium]|nr:MAG: 8-oxo-dGTP diphosphatase [Planctomycetota bacterium]
MSRQQLATLCYVKKDGKTLMMHRVKKVGDIHHGKWNGLGGKFHPQETPEECVCREVYEESGLEIRNPILRGILTFPQFQPIEGVDWYVFVFVAREFKGQLKSCAEGDLCWIEDKELLRLPLWEGDRLFLQWLENNSGFFSAKFVYRQEKLVEHQVNFY